MAVLRKLNKKLDKMFDGQVAAHEDSGCLVLSGELERWVDVVLAGMTAVRKHPYIGLLNDIVCTGEAPTPVRKPRIEDSALEWEEIDVLIIGGGIIGCAIARELSRYKLEVLLVEKEHDVAMQASGRNSGVINSGVDLKRGTLRHRYNKLGNQMIDSICGELSVSFTRTGQVLCFTKRIWEPFMFLTLLYWKWLGIKGVTIVRGDELHRLEPALDPRIGAALYFPSTGVLSPFELTVAYAENAAQNGANISFNTMVQGMLTENGVIKSVKTNRGTVHPKVVVNAAGVFCDAIASLAGDRFYSIHPRKGTFAVIDKKYSNSLARTVISSVGSVSAKRKHTKGGAVIRTVSGNTLVGPDAIETSRKEDYTTAPYFVKELLSAHARTTPELDEEQVLTYFSGIRASTYEEDFVVCKGKYVSNMIHAAGIQSPGLTAAPAISVDVANMVLELFGGGNTVGAKPEFDPKRVAPPRPAMMDDTARSDLIESNPDYGIIICRCEEISKGEILDALRRNVRCDTIDGLKRRVRTGMGRCQGNICTPLLLDIIATEKRIPPNNVKKSGSRSEKLYGSTKAILEKRTSAMSEFMDSKIDPETEELIRENAKKMLEGSPVQSDNDDDDEQI